MEKIMANVWGGQKEVYLGTWEEIKRLGFKPRDRNFGELNDGTPALYFYKYIGNQRDHTWYLTTQTLEEIKAIELTRLLNSIPLIYNMCGIIHLCESVAEFYGLIELRESFILFIDKEVDEDVDLTSSPDFIEKSKELDRRVRKIDKYEWLQIRRTLNKLL